MLISDWSSDVCSSDLRSIEAKRSGTKSLFIDIIERSFYYLSQREGAEMDVRFRLDGKVALVTGAAGALGAHFAATLGGAGATVVLAGRRLQPLQDLAAQLQNNNIQARSEEHTSELQSLMRISYAVFCLKKKTNH